MGKAFQTLMAGAAALALLTACGGGKDKATGPGKGDVVKLEEAPKGQLPTGISPTAYTVDLVTDPKSDTFTGQMQIGLALEKPHARIWLHADGPEVSKVTATTNDGREIEGTFTGGMAEGGVSKIDFAEPLTGPTATLNITYAAPYNRNLAGLYRADQADREYLASQMEPIDARRMMPSFDEPRFKTPWTLSVTTPEGNEVITNGALESRERLEDGMVKHTFATTRPIQTYLVALAVGPYDRVDGDPIPANALRAEPIPFRGFAAAGKGEKLKEAMDATDAMLTIQENYFGVPYPYGKLDLIAVPDFAYGAMENAGAIIYRESALLMDERTSLSQRRGILATHAHELAHQWFGNLVTPKWWDDIWLNEAFATWFSYKTMHAYDPEGGFDRSPTRRGLAAMGADSLANARQIRNPITANGDIMDAFDGITYSKGGNVLAMFENYLGEDAFREGVRVHMRNFEDGIADVNDFMASLQEGSGNDSVVDSFSTFIFQPGIPYLDVQVSCASPSAATITVTQERYAPLGSEIETDKLWQVPFAVRISDGVESTITRKMLTEKTTDIALDACPRYVMPNADGRGYWRFTTNDTNWAGLTEMFADLTGGEQLVFADSLSAAFNAGDVDAATLLSGLKATTQGEWDAVRQGIGETASYLRILPDDAKQAYRAKLGETYAPLWAGLSVKPAAALSQGDTLLREDLYDLMVGTVEIPELQDELAARAMRYVGMEGDADESALAPSELYTAIAIAAERGGREFLDAALAKAYASSNQSERSRIFGALARNLPAEEVAILLKEANGSEFSGREMYATFLGAMSNTDAQDQNWGLFKGSWANLAARTPEVRKANLARAVGAYCDADKAEAAATFFRENAADIPGYERSLAQSLESAKLCAALKAAKADELVDALQ